MGVAKKRHDEKKYQDYVFRKFCKRIERLADKLVYQSNLNCEGKDFVSDVIMRTVPWLLERNPSPTDEDWVKALHHITKNLFLDEIEKYKAQKRIPPHLTTSYDESEGQDGNRFDAI